MATLAAGSVKNQQSQSRGTSASPPARLLSVLQRLLILLGHHHCGTGTDGRHVTHFVGLYRSPTHEPVDLCSPGFGVWGEGSGLLDEVGI
jgi:hypothetical protein